MSADETPDLRVGVLSARTFGITGGRFVPPVKALPDDETWLTATAVAECRNWGYIVLGQPAKHQAPDPDCRCGIYSFTTAQELCSQYPILAYHVIAVIAPEGMSLEGSLGWRSPKATILAVWIRSDEYRSAIAANYPTVALYSELSDLLRDYPAIDSGEEITLKPPENWVQFSVHVPGGRVVRLKFNAYDPATIDAANESLRPHGGFFTVDPRGGIILHQMELPAPVNDGSASPPLPPKSKPKPEPFWLRPKNPRQRWAR